MTAIALTAAQIRVINPDKAEIIDFLAGATITAGQIVYFSTSTGKLALADADAAGTAQARGMALANVAAGQVCPVLIRGLVAGLTLTSLSYDDRLYLSGTAGGLDTAAGTVSVVVGRVVLRHANAVSDKVAYINTNMLTQYA